MRNVIDNVRVNNLILFILKAIKSKFKGSYDKQNLTLVVISYETRRRFVSYISYEMTTRVRSSIVWASIVQCSSRKPELPLEMLSTELRWRIA